MKSRSPSKPTQAAHNDEKLKIIIRIRPILNEEDPSMFVNLEGVRISAFRTTLFKSGDLATTPT